MELQKVVDRLGDLFENEVYRALNLVLSLPDSDYKHDMLHVGLPEKYYDYIIYSLLLDL